jgi:serine/threonine protein kinase
MDMDVLPRGDVFRKKYEVVEKIGAGAFGKVFSVKNKSNKEIFAAKA